MKEDFLHYLWKYQLFDVSKLISVHGQGVSILKSGIHNHNTGPDFLNSKVEIANQLWFGNVEIHVKSSDWFKHKHEIDENYDAVILHVVWEYDSDIYLKNNTPITTLELKKFVSKDVLNNYHNLSTKKIRWIPCEKELHTIDSFLLNNWLERLFISRLEQKSKSIMLLLSESKNHWEAVLFQLLAKNFGLKVNGESFLKLAKSIPFSVLKKEQNDITRLSALFFGQAGFLSEIIEGKIELGMQIDSSIPVEFEKQTKSKNFLFSNSIDFIYEAFNFDTKIRTKNLNKILKSIGKNKSLTNYFIKFADKGLNF